MGECQGFPACRRKIISEKVKISETTEVRTLSCSPWLFQPPSCTVQYHGFVCDNRGHQGLPFWLGWWFVFDLDIFEFKGF